MDVKCERCSTEYEFDDALVSGRGTTVQCTNCGHKFKVRLRDGEASEDFWNITTVDGRALVFTSLRDLQRAIHGSLVERGDRLSRGGFPPKAIGQIPELKPFFDQRDAQAMRPSPDPITGPALAPQAVSTSVQEKVRPRQATNPEFLAPPAELPPVGTSPPTLVGTGPLTTEQVFPVMVDAPPSRADVAAVSRPPPPETLRFVPTDDDPPPPRSAPTPAPEPHWEDHGTVPSEPPGPSSRHQSTAGPDVDDTAPAPRDGRDPPPRADAERPIEIYDDRLRGSSASLPDIVSPRRRSVGGVVIVAVVVACLFALGAVWARKNLAVVAGASRPPSSPDVGPRVASFLSNGEKALADGNVELAKESFDKASALAEGDPHVLIGLARLTAIRADLFWLRSRLLPADAADEHRLTQDSLNETAAIARKAAQDAVSVAPEDPSVIRAKIDALRISNDREGARALVGKITSISTQPESAYVLAALDLAETAPIGSVVVERLKVAASAESGPGRARALLVFALVRSGDVQGAKAEIARMSTMPRQHPLLPLLRAFVEHTNLPSSSVKGDGGVAAVGNGDPSKSGQGTSVHRPVAMPSDPRDLVLQGDRARARGEYDRARTYFTAALEKNANDSEALAGLAAISHARRDLVGARIAYKQVLAINPNYVPALVGLADVEWESGDKVDAIQMYKDIVDRYPEDSYPKRVKQRSEGGR